MPNHNIWRPINFCLFRCDGHAVTYWKSPPEIAWSEALAFRLAPRRFHLRTRLNFDTLSVDFRYFSIIIWTLELVETI